MPTATASDGATIVYDDTGSGSLLVLIHGNTECRQVWDPLVEPLARSHRVVALDLRGHGESERRPPYDLMTMAGDVAAVVTAVDAGPPLVVGHSLGGAVATGYASTAARGVVNIDQSLELTGFKEVLTTAEGVLRDPDTFEPSVRAFFSTFYPPLPAEEHARVASLSHPEQEVLLGTWEVIFHSELGQLDEVVRGIAAHIDVPYLALHGSDPGDGYVAWLQSVIPTVEFDIWPDHGHYPHLVDPGRFVERLAQFEREL